MVPCFNIDILGTTSSMICDLFLLLGACTIMTIMKLVVRSDRTIAINTTTIMTCDGLG